VTEGRTALLIKAVHPMYTASP